MQGIKLIFCGSIICALICLLNSNDVEYDGPASMRLFHSLEEGREPVWIDCGTVTFQNVNLGSFSVTSPPLDMNSRLKMQSLAKKDLLYRLRAIVTSLKGREMTFYTFTRACAIVESGMVDVLTVFLDQSGLVIGVTLSPSGPCDNHPNYNLLTAPLNRTVEFRPIEQGPVPDTASYIQKIEREREAKERGATQDNRSFFAKYWMYIVPVILFAVLSGSANVDAGAGNAR